MHKILKNQVNCLALFVGGEKGSFSTYMHENVFSQSGRDLGGTCKGDRNSDYGKIEKKQRIF